MSEKYKLGLSRNRLFQFNSTVVFCGKFKCKAEPTDVGKALKMLANKVPAITARVELEENSDAFIVTGSVEPVAVFSELDAEKIVSGYEKNPLCFNNGLYEFTVSCDGYFIIAGHTVFCDTKSLLRLAKFFAEFYTKTTLSVEAENIYTFSEPKSLPVDVISPLVNKLSSELDDKWQKDSRCFSVDDFNIAQKSYLEKMGEVGNVSFNLSTEKVAKIREKATEIQVDFSSVVCFAFYKAIRETVKCEKGSSKIRVWADRRFFHGGNKNYSVGAYNGTVSVHLTSKELRKSEEEQIKLFHTDLYKAVTSPFRVFSDEVLLHNVQNSYCDSAYMYMSGEIKSKSSKNLAENYSCMNKELCEFFYCNLTQQFWQGIDFYENITVTEPFMPYRSRFSVSVCESSEGCSCVMHFDKSAVSEKQVQAIINKAQNCILEF